MAPSGKVSVSVHVRQVITHADCQDCSWDADGETYTHTHVIAGPDGPGAAERHSHGPEDVALEAGHRNGERATAMGHALGSGHLVVERQVTLTAIGPKSDVRDTTAIHALKQLSERER